MCVCVCEGTQEEEEEEASLLKTHHSICTKHEKKVRLYIRLPSMDERVRGDPQAPKK